MATVIDGKALAAKVKESVKKEAESLAIFEEILQSIQKL